MIDTDEERAREIGEGIYGDADSGRGARLASRILAAFAAIRSEEREACAKVAQNNWANQKTDGANYSRGVIDAGDKIGDAIRARTAIEAPTDAA